MKTRYTSMKLVALVLTAMLSFWQAGPVAAADDKEKQSKEKSPDQAGPHTAFTYQGQLKGDGMPATGAYSFQFKLYTAQTVGEERGSIVSESVNLANGSFKMQLDFGSAAGDGKESWLEIGVRSADSTEEYTVLTPRQRLTSTPYAIFAQHERWSLIGVPIGFVDSGSIATVGDPLQEGATRTEEPIATVEPGVERAGEKGSGKEANIQPMALFDAWTDDGPVVRLTSAFDRVGVGTINPTTKLNVLTHINEGAGLFEINNAASALTVLSAITNGIGTGVDGRGRTGVAGTGTGIGVIGSSPGGVGVHGASTVGIGVTGSSSTNIGVTGTSSSNTGVSGTSTGGVGVSGSSSTGTAGKFANGLGSSTTFPTLEAQSHDKGPAGFFMINSINNSNAAVYGETMGTGSGVAGVGPNGVVGSGTSSGVRGSSANGIGVFGSSTTGTAGKFINGSGAKTVAPALEAISFDRGPAARFFGTTSATAVVVDALGDGISAKTYGIGLTGAFENLNPADNNHSSALYAHSTGPNSITALIVNSGGGTAISAGKTSVSVLEIRGGAEEDDNQGSALYAVSGGPSSATAKFVHSGGGTAIFAGKTSVSVLEIRGGSDLAERFEVNGAAKPGMVVAIDPGRPGSLCVARGAYNRRVAGVISGANNLDAGMIMADLPGVKNSLPLALSGRVWVNADASNRAIAPGDLLTTAVRPGYAMKVSNHTRAQGAIIGKAITGLKKGQTGMVLVLINLQ